MDEDKVIKVKMSDLFDKIDQSLVGDGRAREKKDAQWEKELTVFALLTGLQERVRGTPRCIWLTFEDGAQIMVTDEHFSMQSRTGKKNKRLDSVLHFCSTTGEFLGVVFDEDEASADLVEFALRFLKEPCTLKVK
ncbi:hypothetical protein KJ969_02760 [Patescibacteria group bacterium]|nr:hypothetical protein [Patescibacteria group bacterium]MBU1922230.1 hypothetical protein [Patescibacteria group bacterium]